MTIKVNAETIKTCATAFFNSENNAADIQESTQMFINKMITLKAADSFMILYSDEIADLSLHVAEVYNRKMTTFRGQLKKAGVALKLAQFPTVKTKGDTKFVEWKDFEIADKSADDVKKAFNAWVKNPTDQELNATLNTELVAYRDLFLDTDTSVQDEIDNEVTAQLLKQAEIDAAREVDAITAEQLEGMTTAEIAKYEQAQLTG